DEINGTPFVWAPPTAPELAAKLADQLQGLINGGSLNQGQGNSLSVKLNHLLEQLEHEQKNTGANTLNSFMNEVKAFAGRNGPLTSQQAASLITLSQQILDLL